MNASPQPAAPPAQFGVEGGSWAPSPLEVRMVLAVLWHRKWVLSLCLLATLGVTNVILGTLPQVYTAHAEIILNNRETRVVDMENVVSDLAALDDSENEQRILGSEALIRRVIERLRLDLDPEFNTALAPPTRMQSLRSTIRQALADGPLAPLLTGPRVDDPALARERRWLLILGRFRNALEVKGVLKTRAITIAFQSNDPAKAALIANTLADLYITDQLDAKSEAARHASSWLEERLSDLKEKVKSSEAAVEAFKAEQAVGSAHGEELTTLQITELTTELASARAERAGAVAQFEEAAKHLGRGERDAALSLVSSELVVRLRANLAELLRDEAELAARYGERHPTLINARAEIRDARAAVSTEIGRIVEGLRNDAAVARAREAALERALSDLEDKSVVLSRNSVALRQLERVADADREIYETFLARFRETSEQEDLQAPDARLLSVATPPLAPSSPNRRKLLILATFIGIGIGLFVVLLLERVEKTFRIASEIGHATGLPLLAALPWLPRRRKRRQILDYVRRRPGSALAEAARMLRAALRFTNVDTPPSVVMITSAGPEEGKSTAALLLAQQARLAGERVILVDCDIRRPTLHATFDQQDLPGLVPVIEGRVDLDAAIRHDLPTGVDMLAAPEAVPRVGEIFASDRFAALIGELKARYDLVILDAPPVLLVADPAAIGQHADTTVFAVRWNATPRAAVLEGIGYLRRVGITPGGCIATLVDQRAESRYAEAIYGSGRGYYASRQAYYTG